MPHLAILRKLEVFLEKKPSNFSEKFQILNVSKKLSISISLYCKFAEILRRKIPVLSLNAVGKHRVKMHPFKNDEFVFIVINMAQNNNVLKLIHSLMKVTKGSHRSLKTFTTASLPCLCLSLVL